ncbi:iron-containing redox enzyme family protein [Streptomyces sp. LX-29]|uniref:iron-containing redox enzyme family protein n=1 Tax=Streptomyces sp. LX-29 TaxID=2900152 RepID=UPI00240DF8A0|nr:iron-containing redox enzyme family protein [Streptomyces sp. LX-29]WFB05810.1 iron-containing redox enzyme family protein [Streptomyces sp. LX-29]
MRLPTPRGEVSAALVDVLGRGVEPGRAVSLPHETAARARPYGEDAQLALYLGYELHYRGFEGVDDAWEWDAELLRLRGVLERRFLAALRADVPCDGDVASTVEAALREPVGGGGVSAYLRDAGEWWQLREYAAHRSLYQLKEADPHAWAIPRLTGRAKAALVAVEYDEFGAGRAERIHADLFAALLADLDLDDGYGGYLDAAPAPTLATVNLMSLLGLHRELRGALVGHFATVEMTSPPASRRMVEALRRLGAGPAAVHFYAEHVEADAVHEQLVRHEVIGDLLRREPRLAPDVVFGVAATQWLEDRLAGHVLGAWREGRCSLRAPL